MSEAALFYGFAEHRLRARCRLGGLLLAATIFAPYELVAGRTQFFWQVAHELPPLGVAALFAPALAGLLIASGPWLSRRGSSLALLVLAALASYGVVFHLGAEAVRWDAFALPESLAERAALTLGALALTAAGGNLAFQEELRGRARVALVAAVGLALLFYAWPARGEAPVTSVARTLAALPELPGFRYQLGYLTIAGMLLWPGIVALAGLRAAFVRPRRDQPAVTLVALYGLPAMMAMLVYRAVLTASVGPGLLVSVMAIVATTAKLGLLASSVEVLGQGVARESLRYEVAPGLPPGVAGGIALGAVLGVTVASWVVGRPPAKGITWNLGAPTTEGDQLFGALLPTWSGMHAVWDARVRHDSGARAALQMKNAGREAVAAARALDPRLGDAVDALVGESAELDLAGRRWTRLVAAVNEASRVAGLPYYLDALVYEHPTDDGVVREFRVRPYAVERVNRFVAQGRSFATLRVHRLNAVALGALLGFSRDDQPYALVSVDEITTYLDELGAAAQATPPRCAGREGDGGDPGLRACGERLRGWAAALPQGLGPAVTDATERHELQHQIDGPLLPIATPVRRRMQGYAEEAQTRVNRELSAYMAELTTPTAPPGLGLIELYRFAVIERRGTTHLVGVVGFEALAGRGLGGQGAELDRDAAGRAFVELAALDEEALRSRAATAWGSLFGARLAEVRAQASP